MVLLPIPFDKLPCFTVVDVTSNLTTAQRVVPVNRLKSGYRHLRLHNEMDQPLPLSQLFLCRYVVIACAHGQFLHNFQDLLIQTQLEKNNFGHNQSFTYSIKYVVELSISMSILRILERCLLSISRYHMLKKSSAS